ncbi:MAG TPA: hypothetical protein VNT51_01985, partial [Miltoncostaeaceae bacterium]|nr:hypothetical protein [Miltoncostaeaceae bacterium]
APVRTADIGGAPMRVAVAGPHVVVIDRRTRQVRAFRADTMRRAGDGFRMPLPAAAAPVDMSASGRVVWVVATDALDSRGWLVRIDLASGRTRTRTLPFAPVEVRARNAGTAFVLTQSGTLYQATMGRLVRRGGDVPADAITAGGVGGWMLSAGDERGVQRIRRVAGAPPVAGLPAADGRRVEVGAGWIWVTAGCGRHIGRVRPSGGGLKCVPVSATRLQVTPDGVWAAGGRRSLARIDPATGEVTRRLQLPGRVSDLAVGGGHLWAVGESGVLARLPLEASGGAAGPV